MSLNYFKSNNLNFIFVRATLYICADVDFKDYNLLGRDTARDLDLLHVEPLVVNAVDSDIYDSYPNLFKRVGTLKGYELKLRVNTSVHPIAQSVRRVSFQLGKK